MFHAQYRCVQAHSDRFAGAIQGIKIDATRDNIFKTVTAFNTIWDNTLQKMTSEARIPAGEGVVEDPIGVAPDR